MTVKRTMSLAPGMLGLWLIGAGAACGPGAPTPAAEGAPAVDGAPGDAGDPAGGAHTLAIPGTTESPAPPGAASGRLVWRVPPGWEEVEPASRMRFAQYRASGAAGEAECVVYYFGPGQGGDARANAVRWAGQFEQPDGSSSAEAMTITPLAGAALPVQVVEVTGTYDGGMTMTDSPAEKKPGYMLLGGIATGPDAPWFFKFTGPESTVRAEREAFLGMLGSLRIEGS